MKILVISNQIKKKVVGFFKHDHTRFNILTKLKTNSKKRKRKKDEKFNERSQNY